MNKYQLVEKREIQHHNEYYELRTTQTERPQSLYFTTNEENLEDVAAAIILDEMPGTEHWTIIPHRKSHENQMYDVG